MAHARMILADSDERREEALTQAHKATGRLDVLLAIGKATEGEAERATQLFSNIALAHKNAQLFPDAIAYARRAIAIAPPVRHVSLGRDAEAIEVLQKAFDLIEEWAREDAHNAAGRMLFASAGRELGNLLRQRDPPRALAIYERALLRLGEIKDNAKARRGEVDLLTGSAYPLRRLGRSAEALQRPDAALRALADHQADTGNPARAIETYRQLLDGVLAAEATPEKNLADTADLSRLYASMAVLHRRVGQDDLASEVDARRLKLWQHWDLKLPKNPFVTAQLAAARIE